MVDFFKALLPINVNEPDMSLTGNVGLLMDFASLKVHSLKPLVLHIKFP